MKYKDFSTKLKDSSAKVQNAYVFSSSDSHYYGLTHKQTLREIRKAKRFYNKYQDLDSYSAWRYYKTARRYNTFMFFSLLWKIFAVLTPLIIVSVILSGDNFKFDFFQFTNRFANLNINFSKPLLDLLKSSNETISKFAWNTSAEGFGGFISNIANAIGGIGVRIGQFLTLIGLIFTFIFDFFSNVFAFLGALIPSLSY